MTFDFGHPYLYRSPYGKCCNKCTHQPKYKDGKAHSKKELTCPNNPNGIGATRYVCDKFQLDKVTWFNEHFQRWEVECYKAHYGNIPLEVFI